LKHFSHNNQPIFTKVGGMIYINERICLILCGIVPDPNPSGYLDLLGGLN